jgi:Zn-dependent protease
LEFTTMDLVHALYQFAILLFSLSVHECAHAWAASRFGDHTARMEGRISLNPTRHIDPIGTLLYPGLMIFGPLFGFTWFGTGDMILGWGRTVPVMTRNLKRITRDDNLIACAGPAANLILALIAFVFLAILMLLSPDKGSSLTLTIHGQSLLDGLTALQAFALLLALTLQINLGLFFFNFVPIPPLDASRIVRNLLPYNSLETFDTIGRFGCVFIFFIGRIVVGLFLHPAMILFFSLLELLLRNK